jgi:hypothetical protein
MKTCKLDCGPSDVVGDVLASASPHEIRRERQDDDATVIDFPRRTVTARAAPIERWPSRSNVVQFRPRRYVSPGGMRAKLHPKSGRPHGPGAHHDDHRRNMLVNLIAAAWSIMLVVAGDWSVTALLTMR